MSLLHMKRRLASVWSSYSGPETPPSSDCGCDQDEDAEMDAAAPIKAPDAPDGKHRMPQVVVPSTSS